MSESSYKVMSVDAGTFKLDGGAMFGVVPKVLWSKSNPADADNRITLAMRPMLAVGSGRVILVDAGIGEKIGEKMRRIYAVESGESKLARSLAGLGFSREDVTDVVISHLHFDHCGGCTVNSGGKLEPAFPNAVYYVQKDNLETALNPNRREKASYLAENFVPLTDSGVLKTVQGRVELFPGVELIPASGHTSGHQIVKVNSERGVVVFCADLIPTSSHIGLPYVMSYDLMPLSSMREKEEVLRAAAENDWILFFEHDPEVAAARVIRTERGYALGDRVEL